jgi:hypothetical protein
MPLSLDTSWWVAWRLISLNKIIKVTAYIQEVIILPLRPSAYLYGVHSGNLLLPLPLPLYLFSVGTQASLIQLQT